MNFVRTSVATRIAQVDRQAFNEAVSKGYYTCAPNIMHGKSRVFSENDILTLFVYGDLLRQSVKTNLAGHLACDIGGLARALPDVPMIYWITGGRGSQHVLPAGEFDPDHRKKGVVYPGIGEIYSFRTFDVAAIRKHVADGIAFERSIIGVDDGDE